MVSQISLLGVTLHLYGLLLGIAILVVLHLFQHLLEKRFGSISENKLYISISIVLIFALLGARAWHVLTDYWLYQDTFLSVLYIWNGGLSIFGALLGGAVGLLLARKKWLPEVPVFVLFDLLALSIPFGQSIGRWANFVNQELYGLPTNLPWAISIDAQHRLPGYEHIERFHPLFLYESIAMGLFGFWLWRQQKKVIVGSGYYLTRYIAFYAGLRFLLDFLRIGVPRGFLMISFNQFVLVLVLGILVVLQFKRGTNNKRKNLREKK